LFNAKIYLTLASKNGAEKPAPNTKNSSASNSVVGHPVTNGYTGQPNGNGYSARPTPNGTSNHSSSTQSAGGHQPQQKPVVQQQRKAQNNPSNGPSSVFLAGGVDIELKVNAIADEAIHLSKYAGELEMLEQKNASLVNQAQASLGNTFRQLHNLLNEREQQLKVELATCRRDAAAVCNTRRADISSLQKRATSLSSSSSQQEVEAWITAWKAFNDGKNGDHDLANPDRFAFNTSALTNAIRQIGQGSSIY